MVDESLECPHCGERSPGGAASCPSCGRPVARTDPAAPAHGEGETVDVDPAMASAFASGYGDRDETVAPPPAAVSWTESRAVPSPGPSRAAGAGPAGDLELGTTLGGRYLIEQHLGIGGMGSVYRARDLELDRQVALKVIRPHLAEDPDILQRFKHEIILSRAVTHRNVVRIFDLGQSDGVRFISMEFVEGASLAAVLRGRGALPVGEAVDIVEQVCLALDAAHNEGVVHRDLKPQNVMLSSDGRVVVMDFGIARSLELGGMTATGSLLGTPDYMSPEQVKGETVDARSDLFALGIMFYQLLTGELPYKGETPMAAMYTRTQSRAAPVRDLKPDLPGFLGDVVGRCLEIQPHKRYQSAREILQDLATWRGGSTHMTVGPTMMRGLRPTTTRARARLRLAAIVGAFLLGVVLVAGGIVLLRSRAQSRQAETPVAAPAEVVSLAILPFRNASGDSELAWLGPGLAEMLRTDVGQTASLRSVSSDRLHQILRDLRVSPEANLDESTLRRLAEFANADTLVWGQFARLGDQIRIDATVRDFSRHVTAPLKVEATGEQQLLRAVQELAQGVRDSLSLSKKAVRELEQQAFIPSASSVVALRRYTEGLELLRQGNNLEAATRLETAIEEDADFALAHSALAQAYLELGRGQKAEESARAAVGLADDLPIQERYLILAQTARVDRDYERGADAYRNLLATRPTDPELNYELAVLYEEGGSLEDAQRLLRTALEADPQNVTAQLALGRVLIKSGSVQDALAPLNQALSLAIQVDNDEAQANSLQALGIAYRYLGRPDDALANFSQSLAIKTEIGDRRGMAASLSMIGQVQAGSGDLDQARASFRQAIDISREIGDSNGLAGSLMELGEVERIAGNFEQALEHTREALRIQMELGAVWNQARSLNNLGTIYGATGEYAEALVYYQRALEIRERLEDPAQIADSLHNIAETYLSMGRHDQAVDHYMRALGARREGADERGAAIESYSLGRVYELQGRFGAALKSIGEAVEILRRLGETGPWYVEVLAGHGSALSSAGRFDEARPVLEEAIQLARQLGDATLLALALDADGDRLVYSGELASAAAVYQQAAASAAEAGDPHLVLEVRADQTRLELTAGRPQRALPIIRETLDRASSRGVRYLETRCQLALGSALLAGGDSTAAEEPARRALRGAEELGSLALLAQSHHLLAETLTALRRGDEATRHRAGAADYLRQIRVEAGTDAVLLRTDLKPIADAATP